MRAASLARAAAMFAFTGAVFSFAIALSVPFSGPALKNRDGAGRAMRNTKAKLFSFIRALSWYSGYFEASISLSGD
jgi:hypothetical protein